MRKLKLAQAALFVGFILYIAFLLNLDQLRNRTVFYVFQTRDLGRAMELLRGHLIFFGPEMSGGGHLFGPLYYFLLAIPLSISAGWTGAWYEMIALVVASATLAWLFLRSRGMALEGLIWVMLFALSWETHHLIVIFMNPSFNFLFVVSLIVLICTAVTAESAKSREYAFSAASLIAGFAIQIHFSVFCLFLAMLYLQLDSRRLHLPKVERRVFVRAMILFALPLVPYFIWSALQRLGFDFGQQGLYVGETGGAFSTWAHAGELNVFIGVTRFLQNVGMRTLQIVPWALPLSVAAAQLIRAPEGEKLAAARLIKPLLVCSVFAFIPYSLVYVTPIANRYGLPFFLSLLFLTVVVFHTYVRGSKRLLVYNLLAGAALLAVFGLLHFSKSHRTLIRHDLIALFLTLAIGLFWERRNPARLLAFALTLSLSIAQVVAFKNRPWELSAGKRTTFSQWKTIWKQIYQTTGWSYSEARERVFFINMRIDDDPGQAYRQVVKHGGSPNPDAPDGFFISLNTPASLTFEDVLEESNIADEIKQALHDGELKLGESKKHKAMITPYWVVSTAHLPKHFHDIGMAYARYPELDIFRGVKELEGSSNLGGGRYLFKWNQCPEHDTYCDVGAVVTLSQDHNQRIGVNVRVLGGPLSQSSPWIHPTWTQAWKDPEIEVKCGEQTEKFKIADFIGYRRGPLRVGPLTTTTRFNSPLAPFERQFQTSCRVVSEITVGWESSTVENLHSGQTTLPGGHLSISTN